ncbi:MAG: DUF5309 domain-containing protein [Candidatus Micrarchaeota archaeon]|nr:DUF5309 domain-containing protein [Candidatus Micrarchaeota archaeon]
MTIPASTTVTYDLKGIREDLTDFIYNVAPTEVPFLSSAKKTKAFQTKHEWQTDTLAAAAQNAKIEGDDATNLTATATVRLYNYTQIANKVVGISGTDRAVRNAGRKDELGYQLMKRAKELKRDMEHDLTYNYASSVGASGTARQMAGLDAWIYTNGIAYTTGGGANPSTSDGTNTRTDASATTTLTEANFKTCLSDIFTAGGNPELVLCSATNKQIFSGFSGNSATRYVDFDKAKGQKLFTAYDMYVSDFGSLRIVPDRFIRGRDVFVLDMDYWKIAYLRPFETEPLAKTGDSDRKMLITEYTLEASNEKASGGVFDTTG